MRVSVVVMMLGAVSLCLGCVAGPSEGELPSKPSSNEAAPDETTGGTARASAGGSPGSAMLDAMEAYKLHHDPGPQEIANDYGEATGAAASACIIWGPSPTGLIADDYIVEDVSIAKDVALEARAAAR